MDEGVRLRSPAVPFWTVFDASAGLEFALSDFFTPPTPRFVNEGEAGGPIDPAALFFTLVICRGSEAGPPFDFPNGGGCAPCLTIAWRLIAAISCL